MAGTESLCGLPLPGKGSQVPMALTWRLLQRCAGSSWISWSEEINLAMGISVEIWPSWYGYGSMPINTIFRGMNIHLPAILMFTRGTRFWHTAILILIWSLGAEKPWNNHLYIRKCVQNPDTPLDMRASYSQTKPQYLWINHPFTACSCDWGILEDTAAPTETIS